MATAGSERKQAYRAVNGDPISAQADIRAICLLTRLCLKALSVLPTTRQHDVQLMRTLNCGKASQTSLAVEYRVCYKGTLQRCIALCERTEIFLKESVK